MKSALGSGLLLLFLAVASRAAAGPWVSGGGELYKDANNPWFMANTKDVTYCITIDAQHFSRDLGDVEPLVARAILYWQVEFAASYVWESNPAPWTPIATQTFHLQDCTPDTDLRFQFGFLTADQRAQITTPANYIGLAIRTDYDFKTMRGKGFVYIAPDSGPDVPTEPNMRPDPWRACDGMNLLGILTHELGHVFGLPHRGDSASLMGYRFAEKLLVGSSCYTDTTSFFSRSRPVYQAIIGADLARSMGLGTPGDAALTVRLRSTIFWLGGGFDVLTSPDLGRSWTLVGTMKPDDPGLGTVPDTEEENDVWMPAGQQAFKLDAPPANQVGYWPIQGNWATGEGFMVYRALDESHKLHFHVHTDALGMMAEPLDAPAFAFVAAQALHQP